MLLGLNNQMVDIKFFNKDLPALTTLHLHGQTKVWYPLTKISW